MNTKNPKVSVLMPNYNCEKYLVEAIESILNQSFTDFEFIIVDDGSSDKSWEVIQEYAKKDKRIVAIQNPKNLWVQNTRNLLFKKAKWNFYALFDSDDISISTRLETQVKFLEENKEYVMCGTNFTFINNEWKGTINKFFPELDVDIRESFFYRNPFGQNTVLIRATWIEHIWWYDPSYEVTEDLDLRIRLWAKYKLYNIQENLVKYRVHWENSILRKQKLMIKNTLRARKNAMRLWYIIWLKWRIHYIWTWVMQYMPPRFVLWLFNKVT